MVNCISITIPLLIRNSIGRTWLNIKFVCGNWLLIVKKYTLRELSFCNKLTGNFCGLDFQIAAKCPLPHFWQVFPFVTVHLFAILQMGWTLTGKTAFIWRKLILILCYFQPCHTSVHFIQLHNDWFLASSIAWAFSTTFSSARLGYCSK